MREDTYLPHSPAELRRWRPRVCSPRRCFSALIRASPGASPTRCARRGARWNRPRAASGRRSPSAWTAPTKTHYYYRCEAERKTRGTTPPCPNRRSHRAHELEHAAAGLFEAHASRDGLLDLFDATVARREERDGMRGELERRAALSEKLPDLELERRGYLRQNARGLLSDAEALGVPDPGRDAR